MPASEKEDRARKAPADTCGGFFKDAMERLAKAGIPFMVAGAKALQYYTGIERNSGDFDLFLCPDQAKPALNILQQAGYETGMTFPHWLAKAHSGQCSLDLIFRSGNGVSTIEPSWFDHAPESELLGMQVKICPAEEIIWIKSYIQERERFDGADIAHLIVCNGPRLDWHRLLDRFGTDWRLLLGHLVFVQFSFPSERECIPAWVMEELIRRLQKESPVPAAAPKICLGTLISRTQYLPDLRRRGYEDGRRERSVMTDGEIRLWTEAIDDWRIPK